MPVLCCPSGYVPHKPIHHTIIDIPKFGRGSRSCAGREKRTAARSETPINLRGANVSSVLLHAGACRATYLRRMPKKVLNLELSSGGFSAVAPGVEAREAAFEGAAEFVVEPGRAFSAARSAMVLGPDACVRACLWNAAQGYVKLV